MAFQGKALMPIDPPAAPVVAEGAFWHSEPDTFTLDAPGLARVQVEHGEAQPALPAPGAGPAEARLIARTLPAAAAWVQRGWLVLHAAGVVTPDGAIALAGHSTAGKSVLAAALAQRGCPLLADEVLAIELNDSGAPPLAHPGDADVLLWRRAAERLGYDPATLAPARAGLERYWLPPLPAADAPVPLARIYLLEVHGQPEVQVEWLRGRERALALMRHAFNRRLAETPARRRQMLLRLAALPKRVGVARLRRPEAGWTLDAVLAALDEPPPA